MDKENLIESMAKIENDENAKKERGGKVHESLKSLSLELGDILMVYSYQNFPHNIPNYKIHRSVLFFLNFQEESILGKRLSCSSVKDISEHDLIVSLSLPREKRMYDGLIRVEEPYWSIIDISLGKDNFYSLDLKGEIHQYNSPYKTKLEFYN